jgi:hypothetical protein
LGGGKGDFFPVEPGAFSAVDPVLPDLYWCRSGGRWRCAGSPGGETPPGEPCAEAVDRAVACT